jgi:hypothetical protein
VSEADLQRAVIALAKLRGWLYFHDTDSRRNRAGFPDLVLLHPRTGRLLWVELKAANGRLRPEQVVWLDALRLGGHEVAVWRPADLQSLAVARELSRIEVAA